MEPDAEQQSAAALKLMLAEMQSLLQDAHQCCAGSHTASAAPLAAATSTMSEPAAGASALVKSSGAACDGGGVASTSSAAAAASAIVPAAAGSGGSGDGAGISRPMRLVPVKAAAGLNAGLPARAESGGAWVLRGCLQAAAEAVPTASAPARGAEAGGLQRLQHVDTLKNTKLYASQQAPSAAAADAAPMQILQGTAAAAAAAEDSILHRKPAATVGGGPGPGLPTLATLKARLAAAAGGGEDSVPILRRPAAGGRGGGLGPGMLVPGGFKAMPAAGAARSAVLEPAEEPADCLRSGVHAVGGTSAEAGAGNQRYLAWPWNRADAAKQHLACPVVPALASGTGSMRLSEAEQAAADSALLGYSAVAACGGGGGGDDRLDPEMAPAGVGARLPAGMKDRSLVRSPGKSSACLTAAAAAGPRALLPLAVPAAVGFCAPGSSGSTPKRLTAGKHLIPATGEAGAAAKPDGMPLRESAGQAAELTAVGAAAGGAARRVGAASALQHGGVDRGHSLASIRAEIPTPSCAGATEALKAAPGALAGGTTVQAAVQAEEVDKPLLSAVVEEWMSWQAGSREAAAAESIGLEGAAAAAAGAARPLMMVQGPSLPDQGLAGLGGALSAAGGVRAAVPAAAAAATAAGGKSQMMVQLPSSSDRGPLGFVDALPAVGGVRTAGSAAAAALVEDATASVQNPSQLSPGAAAAIAAAELQCPAVWPQQQFGLRTRNVPSQCGGKGSANSSADTAAAIMLLTEQSNRDSLPKWPVRGRRSSWGSSRDCYKHSYGRDNREMSYSPAPREEDAWGRDDLGYDMGGGDRNRSRSKSKVGVDL